MARSPARAAVLSIDLFDPMRAEFHIPAISFREEDRMFVQLFGTSAAAATRPIRIAAVNFETPVVEPGTALLLVAEENDLDLRDAWAAANDDDARRLALACGRLAARVDSAREPRRIIAVAQLFLGDHA